MWGILNNEVHTGKTELFQPYSCTSSLAASEQHPVGGGYAKVNRMSSMPSIEMSMIFPWKHSNNCSRSESRCTSLKRKKSRL